MVQFQAATNGDRIPCSCICRYPHTYDIYSYQYTDTEINVERKKKSRRDRQPLVYLVLSVRVWTSHKRILKETCMK